MLIIIIIINNNGGLYSRVKAGIQRGPLKSLFLHTLPLESVGIPNRNIGSIQRFFLFTVARGAQPPLHFQEGGLSPSCPHVSTAYVKRNSRVCVCINKMRIMLSSCPRVYLRDLARCVIKRCLAILVT